MSIECVRCGNCCPNTCPDKKREDNGLVTCLKHPSLIGNETRGPLCEPKPIYWLIQGVACRAIYLPEEYSALKTVTLQDGQVVLKSYFPT